ncbi:MAG: M23 family metallopeptidase [Candidatus Omnitrophota bacterium]
MANKGVDIAFNAGENILASREGEVIFIADMAGYGKTLIINHLDNLTTIYCGSSDIVVKKGQRVTQGMVIAKSGISPRKSKPTMHFEIRKKHKPQNPLFYLN